MSIFATAWAFDQKGIGPERKLLLIVLADYHSREQGAVASLDRLSATSELPAERVRELMQSLAELGLVRIEGHACYSLGCDLDGGADPLRRAPE